MVFGAKADEAADLGNRMGGVFQMLDRNVDADGIQKSHGRFAKLSLKQMVKRRFARTARPRNIPDRKLAVEMSGDVFHGKSKRLIKGEISLFHARQKNLQKAVGERVGFQGVFRDEISDLQNSVF